MITGSRLLRHSSLVWLKISRSADYCPATKKTFELKYTDVISFDPFPSSSLYPTKVSRDIYSLPRSYWGHRIEAEFQQHLNSQRSPVIVFVWTFTDCFSMQDDDCNIRSVLLLCPPDFQRAGSVSRTIYVLRMSYRLIAKVASFFLYGESDHVERLV